MKLQRLATVLTVVNFVLLMFVLVQARSSMAQGVAPVIRGRALEIVDGQGRVPAEPTPSRPDAKGYPDTVMLRLVDPNGRPGVKLGASEQGAGLGLAGESEPTYVLLKAEGPNSSMKLTNKDGREHLLKP
ncbi:MAG: hypothetical protein AUH30_02560 [Candidatus Rokubacteria bacterium 13_1_40CM_68_15]|nr:MAG: hypothetical protein AUH30_02560 [Candidatus Rokubacteria bacterium 13_1_40CM_68_15]